MNHGHMAVGKKDGCQGSPAQAHRVFVHIRSIGRSRVVVSPDGSTLGRQIVGARGAGRVNTCCVFCFVFAGLLLTY